MDWAQLVVTALGFAALYLAVTDAGDRVQKAIMEHAKMARDPKYQPPGASE